LHLETELTFFTRLIENKLFIRSNIYIHMKGTIRKKIKYPEIEVECHYQVDDEEDPLGFDIQCKFLNWTPVHRHQLTDDQLKEFGLELEKEKKRVRTRGAVGDDTIITQNDLEFVTGFSFEQMIFDAKAMSRETLETNVKYFASVMARRIIGANSLIDFSKRDKDGLDITFRFMDD
jgi:hypothetical protein